MEQLADLELTPDDVVGKKFYRGRGCGNCNNTGFKGRKGLFELMPVNDIVRDLINRSGSTVELRDAAIRAGMRPLRVAAMKDVFDGNTTIEEAIRETTVEA
jgi:type IV pilus assembly protein PilB